MPRGSGASGPPVTGTSAEAPPAPRAQARVRGKPSVASGARASGHRPGRAGVHGKRTPSGPREDAHRSPLLGDGGPRGTPLRDRNAAPRHPEPGRRSHQVAAQRGRVLEGTAPTTLAAVTGYVSIQPEVRATQVPTISPPASLPRPRRVCRGQEPARWLHFQPGLPPRASWGPTGPPRGSTPALSRAASWPWPSAPETLGRTTDATGRRGPGTHRRLPGPGLSSERMAPAAASL